VGQPIKATVAPEETVPPVPLAGLGGFIAKFTVLRGAQRELWLTFLVKFLIYTAYSVTNKTMVLWLSNDLGFSDQAPGALTYNLKNARETKIAAHTQIRSTSSIVLSA
jgi:hypothetical protein